MPFLFYLIELLFGLLFLSIYSTVELGKDCDIAILTYSLVDLDQLEAILYIWDS